MLSGRFKFGMSFFALVAAFSLQFVPGCSNQSEGERCARTNGNRDCSSGLICVAAAELRNGVDEVDRCCPESGSSVPACRRGSNTGTGGSATGGTDAGGAGGGGGMGGGLGVDAPCAYNSECQTNLICGPTGKCQLECLEDRDCASGKSCNKNVCE